MEQHLGPLYQVHPDASYDTLVHDGLGSVRLAVSGTGAITGGFDYTAYGATVGAFGTSLLGFAGELQDPSGPIYLRARWYDPAAGRFVVSDRYEGAVAQPVSLNWYTYANGNPANFVDPLGMFCVGLGPAATAAIGRIVLGAAATGGGGVGMCVDAQTGLTVGAFAQAGAFAGTPVAAISFPDQSGRPVLGGASGNATFGKYAGGGLGIFLSDAQRIGDLRDAFTTYAVDTAAGSVSLAQSGGVWIFTAQPPQTSRGTGWAVTRLQTYTWILADVQLQAARSAK